MAIQLESRVESGGVLPSTLNFLAPSIVPDLLRLGQWTDGGYVVPYSAVASADALISCGINRDWSFEKAFHEVNPRAIIHAYDHTISLEMFRRSFFRGVRKWLVGKRPQAAVAQQFWLWRDFRAFFGSRARHYEEKIVGTECGPREAEIGKLFSRIGPDRSQVFLKLDIEGDEYLVIDEVVRHSHRITALAIEFHNTSGVRAEFSRAITELQRNFEIVHLHGNNCGSISEDGLPTALEISFVRRSSIRLPKRTELPLLIDRPNDPRRPDFPLRFAL